MKTIKVCLAIICIMLFQALFPGLLYSQGRSILSKEMAKIDSLLIKGEADSLASVNNIIFLNLMYDLFDYDLINYDLETFTMALDKKEFSRLKSNFSQRESFFVDRVDSVIASEFVPHKYGRFKRRDVYDDMMYDLRYVIFLHYLHDSLDNHVLDFRSIFEYHFDCIAKLSNEPDIHDENSVGNILFLMCLSSIKIENLEISLNWDALSYRLSDKKLKIAKDWFDSQKNCEVYDSVFLEEVTDFIASTFDSFSCSLSFYYYECQNKGRYPKNAQNDAGNGKSYDINFYGTNKLRRKK